jgi:MFS transporter, DHA2 family, multidrug resistance protein
MTTPVPVRATRREWIGLAVLALPTVLLSIDVSVLYLALPQLTAQLGASNAEQLWIIDIYSFLVAGFLVTMGNLGDRIGRRRLLLIGGAAFGAASVVAAFSTSPEMLIAARAMLGIAGATLAPSTMALIRNMFQDERQRGVAIGVWFSCFMGGMVLGPLVGGVVLQQFWWGAAFLLGAPVMVVLLVAGPVFLPEYRAESTHRIDLASVALSLGAVLPAIWGLKELARDGWGVGPVAAVAVGAVLGTAFVRRQRRLPEPLLDLRLFRNRAISVSLSVMLVTGVVMAGISLLSTIYLQVVIGLSPLAAGLWLIPQAIVMIIGFQVAAAIGARWNARVGIALGLIICALGFVLLSRMSADSGAGSLVLGICVTTFGVSLPMTLLTGLLLSAAPPAQAGSVSAVQETGAEFGIALGIATVGTLANVVYRGHVVDDAPAGLSGAQLDAAAGDINAALSVAGSLPAELGARLAAVAHAAFAEGYGVAALLSAAALAVLTVVGYVALRGHDGADAPAPAVSAEPQRVAVDA